MASTLQQTTEFPEDITQFDLDDPIEGGPEGIDNEPHLQLAARTNWLRRKLESETRQIIVNDAEGVPHYMVWIPRIILPAGALGTGIPSQDLYLGGFAVDQFLCAVEDGKAISHPLKSPKTNISVGDAQSAAAARAIEGTNCAVLSAREWGHLAWLVHLIGHPLEGPLLAGAFPGKEQWDGRAESGAYGYVGVSGPAAWFHNGLPSGVKDLVGPFYHMCPINMSLGQIVLEFQAELANAISDSDPTINILDGSNAPQGPFYGWPLAGAVLVKITDGVNTEYFNYTALTIDPEDGSAGLLAGCVRGSMLTAHAFDAGASVTITRPFWSVSDAWVGRLDGAIGGEVTDSSLSLRVLDYAGLSPLPTPAVGDVLSINNEDVLVMEVDGLNCVVSRGHNGTTRAAHGDGTYVYRYSPSMTRLALRSQAGYANGPVRGGLLEEYYLREPTSDPGLPVVRLFLGYNGDMVCRGGASRGILSGEPSGGLAECWFPGSSAPITGPILTGFRCVWRPVLD